MTWISPELIKLSEKTKKIIFHDFSINLSAEIFIATKEELVQEFIEELQQDGYNINSISILKENFIPKIVGKYFKKRHEIWIIHEIGENIDTVIHEYLHSIQKCSPNREGIVDFITYKLTGNQFYIDPYDLKDWVEIEKSNGFHTIKNRLIREGDCEEF